ncbi:MAG: hypothetical protein ACLFM0_07635 [Spirochaetales bacterium]
MRRVLIVDSSDFHRRFVSVDLTPSPIPMLSDLSERVRLEATTCDTVLFVDRQDDPVVLKSSDINLGPYPWKRLESLFGGNPGRQIRERSPSGRLERNTTR